MANIKVTVDYPISDGAKLKFRTPCESTDVEGLVVTYPVKDGVGNVSKTFTFVDANGNELSGVGNVFTSDVLISVMLDVTKGRAFIKNADTNTYIEDIKKTVKRMDDERQAIFADAGKSIEDCKNATKKANDAAAGVVTIEQNSQEKLRFWVGTKEEYEAQKDNFPENTFFIIEDDDKYDKLIQEISNFKRTLTSSDDLDAVLENGVYVYSTASIPFHSPFENAAVIEVFGSKQTDAQKIQRATRYGAPGQTKCRALFQGVWSDWWIEATKFEDDIHRGCYYCLNNGVQEWINPPMLDGVEYRTTERYRGNVVYVRTVSVDLVDNGTVTATYCGKGSTDIVRYESHITTGTYVESTGETTVRHYNMPAVLGTSLAARCILSAYSAIFDTFRDGMEVYTGVATVWYTKD